MRAEFVLLIAVATWSCGNSGGSGQSAGSTPKPGHVKITRFSSATGIIPRGMKASVCYGVENAARLELSPPVEKLWPSEARCFDVSPAAKTTYTLTAYGADGSRDTKSFEQAVGAAPPRLYDLSANSTDIRRGQQVKICFKVENVLSVKVSPGKLPHGATCLTDRPSKTTVYKVTALGGDHEMDTGTVTVKVH